MSRLLDRLTAAGERALDLLESLPPEGAFVLLGLGLLLEVAWVLVMMGLALAGCLVHARFDFPFQVHSILFLFILLCAILVNLSRRP